MRSPEQCRAKAKELERLAQDVSDLVGRRMLMEAARYWSTLETVAWGRTRDDPEPDIATAEDPSGHVT